MFVEIAVRRSRSMRTRTRFLAASLTAGAAAGSAAGQWAPNQPQEPPAGGAGALDDPAMHDLEWKEEHTLRAVIAPYFWAPSLSGTLGVAGNSVDVDATFIDVLDNAESVFGLMAALDLSYDRWVFYFNYTWMTMEMGGDRAIPLNGDLDADFTTDISWIEFFAGYRFIEKALDKDPMTRDRFILDGFVGGRVSLLDVDATLTARVDVTLPDGTMLSAGDSVSPDVTEGWVDPIVGLRVGAELDNHWQLALRGDVGGFGVGSEFSWQTIALLGYQWHMKGWNLSAYLGFRALSQDYENGGFEWDMIAYGPFLGVAFEF